MSKKNLKIHWPNNLVTFAEEGEDWFLNAKKANIKIPTRCFTGSCGACEIDVNGKTVRACISNIEHSNKEILNVEFTSDPFWN